MMLPLRKLWSRIRTSPRSDCVPLGETTRITGRKDYQQQRKEQHETNQQQAETNRLLLARQDRIEERQDVQDGKNKVFESGIQGNTAAI